MKAKSLKGISPDEISNGRVESMADGSTPTLVNVYLTIVQDHAAVTYLLDKKGIAIFGATTEGKFIDGDVGESVPQGT